MNEDQADQMLDYLESIVSKLDYLINNVVPAANESSIGDVCTKLDSVISELGDINGNTA